MPTSYRATEVEGSVWCSRPRPAQGAWRFVNGLSRLVVDPERFIDEGEEMLAVGVDQTFKDTHVPTRHWPTVVDVAVDKPTSHPQAHF